MEKKQECLPNSYLSMCKSRCAQKYLTHIEDLAAHLEVCALFNEDLLIFVCTIKMSHTGHTTLQNTNYQISCSGKTLCTLQLISQTYISVPPY